MTSPTRVVSGNSTGNGIGHGNEVYNLSKLLQQSSVSSSSNTQSINPSNNLQQQQPTNVAASNNNKIVNPTVPSTSNSTSTQSTSPSSAPISIPPRSSTPTIPINLPNSNNNTNTINNSNTNTNNNNQYTTTPTKSPYNTFSYESPSTPTLSPYLRYSPFSPSSPTNHFHRQPIPSPPSPIRVGHRPLFVDGPIFTSPSSHPSSNNAMITMMSNLKIGHHSQFSLDTHPNGGGFGVGVGVGGGSGLSFGSFQESILSGNMSNTPSTVFDGYLGDLGVSGKDYLPPHKKIPYSAIYYHVDYDAPYAATIELGPKGYRVPQKGLIQLTLFNPNHTPIKTFLVNFDLTNMPPETKTFIRQRIISVPVDNTSSTSSTTSSTTTSSIIIMEYSSMRFTFDSSAQRRRNITSIGTLE
ncbi:hypothetical protein SAMD00019534_009110 [Acytostelium subglobosum LB1]|uniref:hypothetical protein n=1 Tax=Acytostelium subglobosum LB1 TaxID=1410327 RepID=UPI000644BBF3|nr:hypothetical protein SAMD00019534_009110 [Acytostelium subglobosum LB1]GAM17736.1 hypothetical protein SAMD00019534_009110 [Acytostelium subglobosum LB1]|eukprot:XP_012758332.1 hypothetical protein SAMD00019534_009110 [Acytostelium subglobosum LB1]